MAELVIAPGPGVAGGLTIPAGELEEGLSASMEGVGEVPVPAPLPGTAPGR